MDRQTDMTSATAPYSASGVPVLTGPNVQNFQEIANEFHREGALVFVKDAAELAREIVSFVTDKARRDEVGGKGRALIEPNRGGGDIGPCRTATSGQAQVRSASDLFD